MPELPTPVQAGQPVRASWLNNVAALASGHPTLKGQGYSSSTGTAFAIRGGQTRKGFGKHVAVIAQGLHDPPLNATEYRSPAYGDVSMDSPLFIDWAFFEVPANALFMYEEIDGKIHVTPLEC